MILTVAFDVRNYVEVMEGWPIEIGDTTFFLERKDDVVQKVCVSYSGVATSNAPSLSGADGPQAPTLTIRGGGYPDRARKQIQNWQAVISGQQIFDIDFDNYELRFHPESIEEESSIQIKSFSQASKMALNSGRDFEQIGRAFCVGEIEDFRIESASHYREGRIAMESGRYVDSYNNMYLFAETRYCDGKHGTAQQVELLHNSIVFMEALNLTIKELNDKEYKNCTHLAWIYDPSKTMKEKIRCLVELRGKLRHHSLKSPHRWDPNKQNEYEIPARFIGSVVGDIVIKESLEDIYAPENLKKFKEISISTGNETKILISTHRIERKPSLLLDMSFPTTVISSQLCLVGARNALSACDNDGQLADTVKLDASDSRRGLDLFSLELGIWAYTPNRNIDLPNLSNSIRCKFEHFKSGIIMSHEFKVPHNKSTIDILDSWKIVQWCFDWIEEKDPTTRIMSLKLFVNDMKRTFLDYKVAAQVKN